MQNVLESTAVAATPWWKQITRNQWYVLGAGQIGYALDAFDVLLYVFCLTTIMKEWNLNPASAGFMVTVTLFASSFGGMLFGAIADRIGRKKALMMTVLLFSVCSGLSGLAQNLTQLAIARTILGLGMGGEWSTGALLVAETWPKEHRGKAMGVMQSGWALGYILASIAAIFILPQFGWRAMFFLGVIPALFTVWVRTKVEEPEIWLKSKNDNKDAHKGSFVEIFKGDLLRKTVCSTIISSIVMFAYWGLFSWLPGFLSSPVAKGGAGLSMVKAPMWMIPTMTGAFFGYISFGVIADRFGRRPTFAAYLAISAVLVYLYGHTRDTTQLMILGPLVGFFGSGYFAAFGAFISELFPTRTRGSAIGFCYNTGRMMSAFAPTVIGYFSTIYGLGGALTITAGAFILGACSIFLVPETRGTDLA
jgi:MFS family permease